MVHGVPATEYFFETKTHAARDINSNRTLCGKHFAGWMVETSEEVTCKICIKCIDRIERTEE